MLKEVKTGKAAEPKRAATQEQLEARLERITARIEIANTSKIDKVIWAPYFDTNFLKDENKTTALLNFSNQALGTSGLSFFRAWRKKARKKRVCLGQPSGEKWESISSQTDISVYRIEMGAAIAMSSAKEKEGEEDHDEKGK